MDRREFSSLLPALLAATALLPEPAEAQTVPPVKPAQPLLASGVFKAAPPKDPSAPRVSRAFIHGMLKSGNAQIEIHETVQQPGAVHEAVGTHLHSEIWLVREGVCELNINGVSHRMEAGDVGLVTAGDKHYIANAGDTVCSYFVVNVGPPE